MRIDWNNLKKFVQQTNLYKYINYIELPTSFYVWLSYENESFSVMLDKGSANCDDFKNNFKSQAILKNNIADDGVQLIRTTFVGRSRMLHCLFVNFKTSIAETDDNTGNTIITLLDSNNIITSDSTEAVCTQIDFCPGENISYSIYGGGLEVIDSVDSVIKIDAILAPDIPSDQGGKIYFIKNKLMSSTNQYFVRNAINAGDIPGIKGYNVLRMKINHEKGIQKRLQIEIQYYV